MILVDPVRPVTNSNAFGTHVQTAARRPTRFLIREAMRNLGKGMDAMHWALDIITDDQA